MRRAAPWILGIAVLCAVLVASDGPPIDARTTEDVGDDRRADGRTSGLRGVALYDRGRLVVDESAALRLTPASVQKAIIAAVALERLGAEHRVKTTVGLTARPDAEGTVTGDLILHGAGDPTWSARFEDAAAPPLARLASAVAAAGVRRVTGELVLDLGIVPPPRQPTSRPLSDMVLGWSAPVSALAVDEAILRLAIAPGASVGAPIAAAWREPSLPDSALPALRNQAWTVGAERHDHGTVAFLPGWDDDAVVLRGEYPISEPRYDVPLADPHPARRVAFRFRRRLALAGVEVAGPPRIAQIPVDTGRTVASVASPPLAEWLPPVLEDSANWLTEMLLRQIAIAEHGSGRLEDALALVAETLTERVGVSPGDFVLDDGSGLSSDNLITARAVARVFDWAWQRPWRPAFLAALPAPGSGTLAAWPALPDLRAKTGTKRHVAALAGYLLRPGDQPPRSFAILLDHRHDGVASRRAEIAGLLRRWASSP